MEVHYARGEERITVVEKPEDRRQSKQWVVVAPASRSSISNAVPISERVFECRNGFDKTVDVDDVHGLRDSEDAL